MKLISRGKARTEPEGPRIWSEDLTKLYSALIGEGLIKDLSLDTGAGFARSIRSRMEDAYRITPAGQDRERELLNRHRLVTAVLAEELRRDGSNMAQMTALAVLTRHDWGCAGCAG